MPGSPDLLPPDPLQRPIEELRLSIRAYNALKRVGINRIAELSEKTPSDLRTIKNLGSKTLTEIEVKLKGYVEAHPATQPERLAKAVESGSSPVDSPLGPKLTEDELSSIPGIILLDALRALQWTPEQWADYIASLKARRGLLRGNYSLIKPGKHRLGNEQLSLTLPARALSGLSTASMENIESLLTLTVADVAAIPQLGRDSIVAIFDLLQSQLWRLSTESQATLNGEAECDIQRKVESKADASTLQVRWSELLQTLISELQVGRLHPTLTLNGLAITDWIKRDIAGLDERYRQELCNVLQNKLDLASIDEELAGLLQSLNDRQKAILLARFSEPEQTLQGIADGFGLTRERVRQLEKRACTIVSRWLEKSSPWRLRTALLLASDMRGEISLPRLESDLVEKGLLEKTSTLDLTSGAFGATALDVLLTMVRANEEAELPTLAFRMPNNLVNAVEYRGFTSDEVASIAKAIKERAQSDSSSMFQRGSSFGSSARPSISETTIGHRQGTSGSGVYFFG